MFFNDKQTFKISLALIWGCFGLFACSPALAETKDVTNETVSNLTISTESGTDILNLNDAGVADKTTINAGGIVNINNNGSATNTEINADGELNVEAGGVADTTTINADGNLSISSGGKANTVTVNNDGYLDVGNDGTANSVTINTGGEAFVSGTIDTSTVNDGGSLYVGTNGTATNTTIKDGGLLTTSGANSVVTDADFEAGGNFNFSTDTTVSGLTFDGVESSASITDKVASGFQVKEGSTLTAGNEGTITASGILGGTAVVNNGGSISDTTIGDGGTLVLRDGSVSIGENVTITETGKFDISTNASFENLDAKGHMISILDRKVEDATLATGGTLTVEQDGSAYNTTVAGGELVLNEGGKAVLTTVNAGKFTVNNGEVNTLYVSGTGVVNASGGTISAEKVDGKDFEAGVKVFDGGTLNISNTAQTKDVVVGKDGTFNLNGGVALNTSVDNGKVNVNAGGNLDTVNAVNGATINASANSYLSNVNMDSSSTLISSGNVSISDLSAKNGTILSLGEDTVLSGTLTMDALTNATGSALKFDNLFTEGTSLNKLVLEGGVNEAFNGKLLNSSSDDKSLALTNGSYIFSDSGQDGVVEVGGWNIIDVTNSLVRLESDLTMSGTEKKFNVAGSSILDVSGTLDNVLNVTLDGNLSNAGIIDFTLQGNSAQDTLTINGNYEGVSGSLINLNINPKDGTSDKLIVNGDVSGYTSLYMKTSNGQLPENNIVFAETTGTGSANAFSIWRVEGSPFNWEVLFENNKWYGYVTDGDKPSIVPETVAYYGLIDNTFMQTASLGANLRNNIALSELRKVPCNVPNNLKYTNRICRGNRPVFTGWVAPVYSTATIETPYNYTASVSGLDGGLDLISDGFVKFGLLASYRQGVYKFEEDGENYVINGDAETTLNSYLGGAYIRIDDKNWSVLAAAYGGMIDADISTADGIEASSSGSTFGATLDVTYIWQNISGIRLQPVGRISYTSVKMDEIEDKAGKKQEFDNASRIEAEAGIRLAKVWEFNDARAEIFVKPALVQTINNSGTFELIEGRELDNTEDRTLVKMETGMSFNMMGNWSASLAGSYSFGSDYENASAGLSLIYNF